MHYGFGILILMLTMLNAKVCQQTLALDDVHYLTQTIDGNTSFGEKSVQEKLYIHHIEDKGVKYSIFWYGDKKTKKSEVNIESHNAPFMIRYSDVNGSYRAKEMFMPSKDKRIESLMWAKISILQYASTKGVHHFKNATGYIEAEQNSDKGIYTIERLRSFEKGKEKKNVKFKNSVIRMSLLEKSCGIWKSLELKENITSSSNLLKLTIKDERVLDVQDIKEFLPKEHWFYALPADIKLWDFQKKKNPMSLSMAQANFQKYNTEMKGLVGDRMAFGEWVKAHMDFLKHLSTLLEKNTLDDGVSKKLFAKLGYLDSVETVEILGQVTMNGKIIEKERFRGAMGFKNTSAPLDDALLGDMLDYGLSADNNPDDLIKNMTGMITGALAKHRMDRVPEQAERIVDSIIEAMQTKENKTVSLAAAGNLLEQAPDYLVEAVDEVLMNVTDTNMRAKSADALSRLEKSTLSTQNFQELIENENSIMTKTSLINASASSTNFKDNPEFNEVLLGIANKGYSKNKISALETLKKSSYANTKEEKRVIRKMMIGEQDSKTLKALKALYRK
ncbi:MAG: hypothetical protein Q9M39_08530 [Sulfurovum sp.]|nr:hypothetical protein [Sulfurovum sp.]